MLEGTRLRLGFGALLSLALALGAAPARAARNNWHELTVGHFHLYSVLNEAKTRDVARHLQAFENTVGGLLRGQDPLPVIPTMIYILSGSDYARYVAPRSGTAGFFQPQAHRNLIAIDGDHDFSDIMETVYHEYTHYIQSSTSSTDFPPWYVEGYAELFSSFTLKDSTISLGRVPESVRLSMADWIPVERLLAVKQSDAEYRTERLAPQFYAEAWILVHMLLFDDATYLRPTNLYLGNMDIGLPEPEAFAKSFDFSKDDLDKALKKLISKRLLRVKRLTYASLAAVEDAPMTAVPADVADLQLTRLSFELRHPPEVVQSLLAEAMKSAKGSPAALALQARILAEYDKPVELSDQLAKFAKGGVAEPQIRLDLAHALRHADVKDGDAQMLALLDDMARLPDPSLETVALWSRAALESDVDPATIRPLLENACARAPHDTQLLQSLARSLEALGDKRGAKAAYARIMLVSKYPEERLWAQKQTDSERLSSKEPASAPARQ